MLAVAASTSRRNLSTRAVNGFTCANAGRKQSIGLRAWETRSGYCDLASSSDDLDKYNVAPKEYKTSLFRPILAARKSGRRPDYLLELRSAAAPASLPERCLRFLPQRIIFLVLHHIHTKVVVFG